MKDFHSGNYNTNKIDKRNKMKILPIFMVWKYFMIKLSVHPNNLQIQGQIIKNIMTFFTELENQSGNPHEKNEKKQIVKNIEQLK